MATVVLGLLIPVAVILLDLVRAASKNQYGLCPGRRGSSEKPGDPPPLTDWVEERLDEIAFGGVESPSRPTGYSADDPLTFADLWGGRTAEDRRRLEADASGRRINLEVMTTNLTQARPYRLPFESQTLYFDPTELEPLFSPRVIEFMKRQRRPPSDDRDCWPTSRRLAV